MVMPIFRFVRKASSGVGDVTASHVSRDGNEPVRMV